MKVNKQLIHTDILDIYSYLTPYCPDEVPAIK